MESLNIWVNNVPAKGQIECYLSPVKAIALDNASLVNPAVTIGGKTLSFPVQIDTGSYLEYHGPGNCAVYGPRGEEIAPVTPHGETPVVPTGPAEVVFSADEVPGPAPRAQVTLMLKGAPLQ